MSASRAPLLGDFETEIALPCRVTYRLDSDGELEITAVAPISHALPEGLRLRFDALPPHEQRCLRAEAETAAEEENAAAKTARALERRDSREALE